MRLDNYNNNIEYQVRNYKNSSYKQIQYNSIKLIDKKNDLIDSYVFKCKTTFILIFGRKKQKNLNQSIKSDIKT